VPARAREAINPNLMFAICCCCCSTDDGSSSSSRSFRVDHQCRHLFTMQAELSKRLCSSQPHLLYPDIRHPSSQGKGHQILSSLHNCLHIFSFSHYCFTVALNLSLERVKTQGYTRASTAPFPLQVYNAEPSGHSSSPCAKVCNLCSFPTKAHSYTLAIERHSVL
jgi:ubiquitin